MVKTGPSPEPLGRPHRQIQGEQEENVEVRLVWKSREGSPGAGCGHLESIVVLGCSAKSAGSCNAEKLSHTHWQ